MPYTVKGMDVSFSGLLTYAENKIAQAGSYSGRTESGPGFEMVLIITENYGGKSIEGGLSVQEDGLKKPFYIETAKKLDAIRAEIDLLYPCAKQGETRPLGEGVLQHSTNEDWLCDQSDKLASRSYGRSVLLTSLLIALDSRCNDMGHHVSYLRK